MESKHQTASVMLKLMGLDEVSPQHPVRDRQKVLSENYLQKVASIGVRKKRSSRQHHYFATSTDEKEESDDVLKVVKTIRRDKYHNPSKGNGKENPYLSGTKVESLGQQLLDPSDKWKPETLVDTTSSFNLEMRDRNKIRYHRSSGKQSSRSFGKISAEVSMQKGNAANRVLDTTSNSFYRENESFAKSSDILEPAPNVSVNEIQCSSLFRSDGSYEGSGAKDKRDVTEKLHEVGRHGHCSTHHQLSMVSKHENGARNVSYQSGCSNDKIRRNIGCKVGMNYRFARKVPMARPLCAASVIADNCGTMTKDDLFRKYWGLRKNASANWLTLKSENRNISKKDCSEDINLRSSSEKSPSFSSYLNINHSLHKLKKRCHGNILSDDKPVLPQLSRSSPSPAIIDSQILQQTCLMNDEVINNKHDNIVSADSSVDCLVPDAQTEVVGRSNGNRTKRQPESTASVLTLENSDSLSHTYASMQQDTSEFQEDSVYSLFSAVDPDSRGSFEEAYEPSPISVLDPSLRDDSSFNSDCGAGAYDSSEGDDEGLDLNVSSDEEDCGNESVGDREEKKDIVGLSRTEESRDFSYVVEVLTEAGISNRSLFTNSSTWHATECPISPSVFEILEKKFGEQQLWKRSERRLLFDRINLGLLEILQPYLYIPMWEKPVSRRLNAEPSQDMIEEEMWGLLVSHEKKAGKETADNMLGGEIRWIELGEDVEDIVREIVNLLIEDLANEIVSLENF